MALATVREEAMAHAPKEQNISIYISMAPAIHNESAAELSERVLWSREPEMNQLQNEGEEYI